MIRCAALIVSLFSIIALLPSQSLHAEDIKAPAEEKTNTTAPIAQGQDKNNVAKEISPGIKKLQDALGDITKPLDGLQRRHFFMVYNNNNMISTTRTVRSDVGQAIEACGKNNPDMKEALDARFKTWNEAVSVQIEKAEANRDNMILAQDYTDSKNIRNVMKIADDLREETQLKIEKTPVSSKEACDYLLNKMDETQETLIKLLENTLISFPQALQNDPTYLEEQEKAKKNETAKEPAPAAEAPATLKESPAAAE